MSKDLQMDRRVWIGLCMVSFMGEANARHHSSS